ncbi:hypothetical protein, partial [Streptococcus pseudopneumoniae]|uniref:hypothetical protein n=1 Tax=Streptococcus pseudopneumoniae TaxID=257758 RepID=UPI001BB2B581
GESIIIGSSNYNSPGSYTVTLQSSTNCDSIVQLNLQVHPNYIIYHKAQVCVGDSYTVGNSVYTSSGVYLDTFSTIYGCDSIITTDLKVADPLTSIMNAVICFGDSLQVNNKIFNENGTYYDTLIAVGGCDSIVTIDLIVLEELETSITAEICETEFVLVGNVYYWHTGIYTTMLTSVNGCDST